MFWKIKKNKPPKQQDIELRWKNAISTFTDALEEGDNSHIHMVYCAFATSDEELVRRSGRAVRRALATYGIRDMIKLSEQFRQYTSIEWSVNWNHIDLAEKKHWFELEEDYRYALIIGSFHPNGYYRERCIREMEACEDTLPYMILRINDWVKQVRTCAYEQSKYRLERCVPTEIFLAFPALQKVKYSGRRENRHIKEIKELMLTGLEKHTAELSADRVARYEHFVRKELYRFLFSRKVLGIAAVNELLDRERDSFCQAVIINGILAHYDCSDEQLTLYQKHKSFYVRRRAVEYTYSRVNNCWDGLEERLLDKNRGVRELAVFILRRHSTLDVLKFYTEHLHDADPIPSITGLGDIGTRTEAQLLHPFLESGSTRILKSTLLALGKCAGEEAAEVFRKYVMDERPGISKAAYISVCNNDIRFGAAELYDALCGIQIGHVRKHLLYLLMREESWRRLPYLLRLYGEPVFEEFEGRMSAAIYKRNVYGRVTKAQEMEIRAILEEKKGVLTEWRVKAILLDLKYVVC